MSTDPVSDIKPIQIPLKNTITKRFQLKYKNGQAYDLSSPAGQKVYLAIKDNINSTEYKLEPVECGIDDAVNGKISYEFTSPLTDEIYEGLIEFVIEISAGVYKTAGRGRFIVPKTLITALP